MVEGQGINTLQHAVPAPCRSSTLPFQAKIHQGEQCGKEKDRQPGFPKFPMDGGQEMAVPIPSVSCLFPVFTSWFGFSSEILHTQGTETLLTVIPLLSEW